MVSGMLAAVGTGNSVMAPAVVIRPIRLADAAVSVNQRAPSGPVVIPSGVLPGEGRGNSVMAPAVVIRPMWLAASSANQRLPSGPGVISCGELAAVVVGNSSIRLAVMAKLIESGPGVVFDWVIAVRNEPGPLSEVLVTVKTARRSRRSISST